MSRLALGILISLAAITPLAEPGFEPSVPDALKTQILQDLNFVQGLQGTGATDLFQQIFEKTSVNGPDLIDFFNQRIEDFNMGSCGGSAAVVACVQPRRGHTLWITNSYQTYNIPQMYRISVIFHESRHTERDHGYWGHTYCPTPYLDETGHDIVGIISGAKLAGLAACDDTPVGAYGLQAVLLKNIEKECSNCNQKTIMDAKLYGDDTINRISDLDARKQLQVDLQGQ